MDDGLIVGSNCDEIGRFLNLLGVTYKIKVQERPTQHLGCTLQWNKDGSVNLHQRDFTKKALKEFGLDNVNVVKAPAPMNIHDVITQELLEFDVKTMQKALGHLIHLATHTCPNIQFTVNLLSQFANKPSQSHWKMVKHVFRYLKGTKSIGLLFTKSMDKDNQLCGWANANYGRTTINQKSTTGYFITLYGNPVSWTTKKQTVVAQSTTKAEFIAMNLCAKQAQWLSTLILSVGIPINKPKIKNNNQGANFISKEAQLNPNSRHIKIRFQYIQDLVQKSLISIEHAVVSYL